MVPEKRPPSRFCDPAEAFREAPPLSNDHQDFDVFINVDVATAPPPLGVAQPGLREDLGQGPASGRSATQGHDWMAFHPATEALLLGQPATMGAPLKTASQTR